MKKLILRLLEKHSYNNNEVYTLYDELQEKGLINCNRESFHRAVRKYNKKNKKEEVLNKLEANMEVNQGAIYSKSKRIKTLEDLLTASKVDLNIWNVDRYKVNKWEVGTNVDGEILIEPLYQVSANLSKKQPDEQKIPVLKQVVFNSFPKITTKNKVSNKKIKTSIVIADHQVGYMKDIRTGKLNPFHDREVMDIQLQVCKETQPDEIILAGDCLDMAEASKYIKLPEFFYTMQPAINEFGWFLYKLREYCPDSKIVFLAGNHECFDEETEILTDLGFKKYYECDEFTKIGTYNELEDKIEFQPYIEKQVYDYEGDIYSIVNNDVDLLITPEHRILYSMDGENWKKEPIKDVDIDSNKVIMRCSGSQKNKDCDISDTTLELKGVFYISLLNYDEDFSNNIPSWFYKLSDRQFDLFLRVLIDEGGSIEKERYFNLYGGYNFLDTIQRLCLAHGYKTSLEFEKEVNNEKHYKLRIIQKETTHFEGFKNYVKKQTYEGKVWDFTVPNDTLIVRRNGKVCITGNCRLNKSLIENMVFAYNLRPFGGEKPVLGLRNLLGLDNIGVEFIEDYPSGFYWVNDDLKVMHGDYTSTTKHLNTSNVSSIIAHIHKIEQVSKTVNNRDGQKTVTVTSVGCSCKIDGTVPGYNKTPNWQQGFLKVESIDNTFNIQQYRIENGVCIFRGKVYEGVDYENDIKALIYFEN